ncbi:MAG: flagellar protein FlaG [Bacillota bacterium]
MKMEGMREAQPVSPLRPVAGNTGRKDIKDQQNLNEEKRQKEGEKNTDIKAVEKAVDLINKTMESYSTELQFTLHKASGEYMVKVINSKDHSVVREIPPERVLDMVAHFKKVLGLIVDEFI